VIRAIAAVVLAALALSLSACSSAPSDGRSKNTLEVSGQLAKNVCEDKVADRLVGSERPRFTGEEQSHTSGVDWPPFTTSGYASTDAGNYRFVCFVEFDRSGTWKSWKITSLRAA
jgi:hypothetical protein